MITEATIRRIEAKTAAYRTAVINGMGMGLSGDFLYYYVRGFGRGCDGIETIYQAMMQDQLRINERRGKNMKAKKGMTKNQKLKLNKTASAKKKVKATKK